MIQILPWRRTALCRPDSSCGNQGGQAISGQKALAIVKIDTVSRQSDDCALPSTKIQTSAWTGDVRSHFRPRMSYDFG
jgi:hypothetical protein